MSVKMADHPIMAANRRVQALVAGDAFEGVLLIVVAALAMVAANSALSGAYFGLFHGLLAWSPIAELATLHLWINDGLMALFFFAVGAEVKREVLEGNLAHPRQRRLPILAAAAGMAMPAAVYLAIAGGFAELHRGWAIPAATDIAFAMGVIGLLGRRVPPALRLFLLTVAVVDDLGAVMIIAVGYTQSIHLAWLVAATVVIVVMIALNRLRARRAWPFALGAVVLWYCVLHSGVHATVAGVVAAMTIPLRTYEGNGLLGRMEHSLAPWNAYLVVPLFGFANAGAVLGGTGMGLLDPLPLAIGAGLVLGKQAGIFGSIVAADRIGFAHRPHGASWAQIWGMSALCGIGFTMSLFIGALAFPTNPLLVEEAKLGVLTGSLVSAVLGFLILRFARPPRKGAHPQ
jgi:NhaA family Na+:H+ antiporter